MPHVVAPVVGSDDDYFWAGVGEDRLLVPSCAQCGHLQHPPSPMCPECGSVEWRVQELAGRGVVYSWIVSRHPTRPDDDPRIVVLVELTDGVRLVSNLVGVQPSAVRTGMPVEVLFGEVDGVRLARFRPADGEAS